MQEEVEHDDELDCAPLPRKGKFGWDEGGGSGRGLEELEGRGIVEGELTGLTID